MTAPEVRERPERGSVVLGLSPSGARGTRCPSSSSRSRSPGLPVQPLTIPAAALTAGTVVFGSYGVISKAVLATLVTSAALGGLAWSLPRS
jgi:hypothetical protein